MKNLRASEYAKRKMTKSIYPANHSFAKLYKTHFKCNSYKSN